MLNHNTNLIELQPQPAAGPENVLAEYIAILWRRRWLIVGLAAGCAVAAIVWSYLQKPVYQARATVVIEQQGPAILESNAYRPQDISPEYFQTHFELMKSYDVLRRAARKLNLADQADYKPGSSVMDTTLVNLMPDLVKTLWQSHGGADALSNDAKEELLLARFSQQIDITPVRGARLAHMTVSSEDSKFAAQAANTLALVYIERTQELDAISKEKAAQWFTEHLDELRKKVEASQQSLYVFRSQHGLMEGQHRQAVATQKLTELNSELVRAELKKTESETRYEQIKGALRGQTPNGITNWSNLDSSSEVLNSPFIQSLRTQEIKVSGQVAELSEKYGPLHPRLAHAKSELQDLRDKLQQEVQKIYDSVRREHDGAIAREQAIKVAVARHSSEKIKTEQYEIELGILEREAESNKELYDVFLKVAKEKDLSSGVRSSNVYLADPAVPSLFPAKPKKKLNAMLGFLLGLMSGVAAALVLESRDRSLRDRDDVERYLPSVSVLGVVPRLRRSDTSSGLLSLPAGFIGPGAESYRSIRTSLLLSASSELPASVLITSPGENEGKTSLAVNLATVMAQLEDSRVLLIDADLRQPNPHKIFQIQTSNGRAKGLMDFLLGNADIHEIIYQANVPNLSVIPKGDCPLNPSELLQSKQMSKLLKWCGEQGYKVILDAPPVLPVTDPVVLAPQVDGVLVVASAGETTREACRGAIQRLQNAGGHILGIVLQKADVTDVPYYSYSTYYKTRPSAGSLPRWITRIGAKN